MYHREYRDDEVLVCIVSGNLICPINGKKKCPTFGTFCGRRRDVVGGLEFSGMMSFLWVGFFPKERDDDACME